MAKFLVTELYQVIVDCQLNHFVSIQMIRKACQETENHLKMMPMIGKPLLNASLNTAPPPPLVDQVNSQFAVSIM